MLTPTSVSTEPSTRSDVDENALFDALEDDTSQAILAAATEQARSVQELAQRIDASASTIYRHVDTLAEHDLLNEGVELDMEGNHRNVYRTAVKRVEIELADETVQVSVEWRGDAVDRFTRLWEDIRRED